MAACKAAKTSSNVSSSTSNSTTNTISLTTNSTEVCATATADICHNFHELCRSCGKTNDQLYDLFQNTPNSNNNNNNNTSSPFNTSSTTCYTHLNNNSCSNLSSPLTSTNKTSTSTTTTAGNSADAVGCTKSGGNLTLDTLAATAKASAKGQSNMENILQEMQIWQLMIKCNDGLPQRICAKCTAQFYMIHKFRRKCLKVQTQLRALKEEQKIHEPQRTESASVSEIETEARIEPALQQDIAVKAVKSKEEKDLVNDKCVKQEEEPAATALVNNNNTTSSVSFETIAGNTSQDDKTKTKTATTSAATLLDNVENAIETMPQKEEAEIVEVNKKLFVATQDQSTLKKRLRLKEDEKKPLLKAAVLKTTTLTLQQSLKEKCDNEEDVGLANPSKKLCIDQEDLQTATKIVNSKTTQVIESLEEMPTNASQELENSNALTSPQDCAYTKTSTDSLLVTKAALKAYNVSKTKKLQNSQGNSTNLEAIANNDNNNAASSAICDNPSEINDNTCSSTSSTSCSSSNSSCSSQSSPSSMKPFRTKIIRQKIVRYVCLSRRSSGYARKMQKLALNQSNRRKQRSWRNKHKLKHLNAMRICAFTTTRPEIKRKNKQCKNKNLQFEDETSSSTVSTTSTTTSSSSLCSTTTNTTTPAVTNLVSEHHEEQTAASTLYSKNAKEPGCCPSMEGISSNKSSGNNTMWKTKAAMKANANDMTEAVFVAQNTTETLSQTTAELTGSACLAIDTSSKTLKENQNSITSSTCSSGNNNNILMQQEYSLTNKENDELNTDNQVKDIEDESATNLNKNNNSKLWSSEESKKETHDNAINVDLSKTEVSMEKENENIDDKEEVKKTLEVLTPPAKFGGMKLIIQRKRGERFKCRRMEDENATATNMQEHIANTTPKRRKKPSMNMNLKIKLDLERTVNNSETTECNNVEEDETPDYEDTLTNESRQVPAFNSEEDENKENPIDDEQQQQQHHDFDSDSNVSLYRDPLLIHSEMLEEDTNLIDFPKAQLSLQTECSKEMYKLYKEKANLESPKKLIVRVPLTSLTQDFKRMHLTMDQETEENQDNNEERTQEKHEESQETNQQQSVNSVHSIAIENSVENKNLTNNVPNTSPSNTTGGESDLLGFSQNTATSCSTVDSSQPSVEMVRYVEPPLCSASSKINDFINDFQNNCIDSSEIEDASEIVPHLGPQITQELSDEIRDVENTLNGILSEMHDKDMYTPRSAETDEFFAHSVYSPLTDTPTTTPAHSFYAESPCTINSNPMSVSPFIHQNMDYNAMTPQSNHSSMGHGSYMGSGSSAGGSSSHAGMFSEHFPTYTECFEETTQSELIGFQNDIPCFENIDISQSVNPANNQEFSANPAEYREEEDIANQNQISITATQTNSDTINVVNNNEVNNKQNVIEYIDLSDYQENTEEQQAAQEDATTQHPIAQTDVTAQQAAETVQQSQEILTNQVSYQAANYQTRLQMPNASNNLNTQPHYIVTNTNQGPIIIANPHLNTTTAAATEQMDAHFKPHSNNLQFVTLGQAMKASNHTQNNQLTEINWPTTVNAPNSFSHQPAPIVTANNGGTTTTYFINANGELYQARINTTALPNPQTPALNTILVPTTGNTNQNFNKAPIDNNENYIPTQQTQPTAHTTANNGQYIMLVNNLGGTPQYYATTTTAAPAANPGTLNPTLTQTTPTSTVLFQGQQTRQLQPTANNYVTNSSTKPLNANPKEIQPTKMPALVPISPNLDTDTTTSNQRRHQMINQHLQRSIKQRQFQLLQPRSPNVTQKITLICRFCHKRPKFNNNVDYSNHIINTHPAEKPYNCPHCPMHFSRRFERQQHVAQVHGSRYQCAQCGLSFCAQRTLDFHLQKYHANTGRSQQQQQLQHQQRILNSTSKITTTNTSTASAAAGPTATYQLLQQNQQQRLVRVEDVHVQMTGENKNKRSINLNLDTEDDIQASQSMPEVELLSASSDIQQQQQQQQQQHTRKLCCPDCNGDNDDCCGSNKNDHDQQQQHQQDTNNINIITQEINMQQPQFAGNKSVNNQQQQKQQQQQAQHITIPSPEQTEPDSTTTLRHFRKRQLSDITPPPPHFATSPTSSCSSATSSSSSSSSSSLNIVHAALNNNNDNLNHNSTDNVFTGGAGEATSGNGYEQIMVERSLRATHNCLLCEDSFTNEIALRKHHHMAHGAAATQSSLVNTQTATASSSSSSSSPLMCTICKRSFRMRNALQRHMETHDAEGRPYECNICQVRFPRPSQLTLHKLTVHKFEKPISCEECGKLFGTETAMKAHAKEHKEAASLITATSAIASTSPATSSSLSSSSPPQLSSHLYLDAMTTKPSSISTTTIPTTTASTSSSAIITNVQNIILQSTTSGEDAITSPTAPSNCINNNNNSSSSSSISSNINNNTVVAYNIATQNTIVSGLST